MINSIFQINCAALTPATRKPLAMCRIIKLLMFLLVAAVVVSVGSSNVLIADPEVDPNVDCVVPPGGGPGPCDGIEVQCCTAGAYCATENTRSVCSPGEVVAAGSVTGPTVVCVGTGGFEYDVDGHSDVDEITTETENGVIGEDVDCTCNADGTWTPATPETPSDTTFIDSWNVSAGSMTKHIVEGVEIWKLTAPTSPQTITISANIDDVGGTDGCDSGSLDDAAYGVTDDYSVKVIAVNNLIPSVESGEQGFYWISTTSVTEPDDPTGTLHYVVPKMPGKVLVTATPFPLVAHAELPDCWSLTGGSDSATPKLIREIDMSIPGIYVIDAKAGTSHRRVRVYVVELNVSFEEFVPSNLALDSCPINGGKRIFVGLKDPSDTGPTSDRSQVKIKIQTNPSLKNLSLQMKTWDVDDPSSSSSPVDSNDTGSGVVGGDNRQTQTFSISNIRTDSAGLATSNLSVSTQPGDNYKISATILTLSSMTQAQADGVDALQPKFVLSEMLTVWRKLHVEVDSMPAISGNSSVITVSSSTLVSGTIYDLKISGLSAYFTRTDSSGITPMQNGDFAYVSGGVTIYCPILTYTQSYFGDDTLRVFLPLGASLAGVTSGTVYDDDRKPVAGNAIVTLPRIPRTNRLSTMMHEAYVDPVIAPYETAPYYDTTVTSYVNLPNSSATTINSVAASQADLISSKHFWVVRAVSAYQPEVDDEKWDHDPDGTQYTLGVVAGGSTIRGALIFLETIRDAAASGGVTPSNLEEQTVVHEIGHLFMLEHSDGKNGTPGNPNDDYIMTDEFRPNMSSPPNMSFGPTCLDKIRSIDHPPCY